MNRLRYTRPAVRWNRALPLGNGHIGVMAYGGQKTEILEFNHCTLWSGYPKDQTNKESAVYLDKVRELIYSGKNREADILTMQKLSGGYSESFLPLGKLTIRFSHRNFNNYIRELDIESAVHTVKYHGAIREYFVSFPDKIAVCRLQSDSPFSITVNAESSLKSETVTDDGLNLTGNAPDHVVPDYIFNEKKPIKYNENNGMAFCLRIEADSDGDFEYIAGSLTVRDATFVTLYIAAETGFISWDEMPLTDRNTLINKCRHRLKIIDRDYGRLKARHIEDYSALYHRQSFSLDATSDLPTDKLIKQARRGKASKALIELYYNYGKYLMISGSREGGQALTLQGLWNNLMRPPWSSNYTLNINTQMNYWAATACNLGDSIAPYVDLAYEIMLSGRKTAQINYNGKGFACNHNSDLWRKTTPVQGSPSYMFSPLLGAWLANELYSHYIRGGLNEYRDRIFQITKEAAEFVSAYLTEYGGHLVVCPSASPEAEFYHDGRRCSLDMASAFDMGIVRQLFHNYLQINSKDSLAKEIMEQIPRLYPFGEGKTGLLEWHNDFKIAEKGHRHFSPLYAFYPANVIRYYKDWGQRERVRRLFEYRTAHSRQFIGWNAAWAICLAARLHDNKKAAEILRNMLKHSVFDNLFGMHPPRKFQIDGNLGVLAGINEMLFYEEEGIIELLPALPDNWESGEVKGILVKGGEISFKWRESKVISVNSTVKHLKILNRNLSDHLKANNIEVIEIMEIS